MVTILAAIVTAPLALKFELVAPKEVRPGETVTVRFYVANQSDKPIVLVRPTPHGQQLGMRITRGIEREGKPLIVDATGSLIVQWFIQPTIGKEAFVTLEPGQRFEIFEESFKQTFPQRPVYKSDYTTLPRANLAAGKYTLRAKYSFQRTFDPNRVERGSETKYTLTPEARRLYHRAWTGSSEVVETLEVREAQE